MKNAYTLKKHKDTGEFHLFQGVFKPEGGCNSNTKSVCKDMDKSDSDGNIFACKDENTARLHCAKHGRKVCGVCVSHLYLTK
jgi:hypothetical protein